MQVYLVGGAVRDRLLGLPVIERDWVVVGVTPEQMLAQGFCQVGKDFPVFLHPDTHEEYALARTERKIGVGYTGFKVHAAPDVTLEDDLRRRDLTINAIAQATDGTIIDPYGGQVDLAKHCLRHVSPAFVEDPLRVLRIARFAARFATHHFTIAPTTATLLKTMVANGDLQHLVVERVWQEIQKAFTYVQPSVFLHALRDCGALAVLLPEVDALFGVPTSKKSHPEIDSGVHTLLAVDQAARLSNDPCVVFATVLHDVGKALTPRKQWPKHVDHQRLGIALVKTVCERLRVPKVYSKLALLVCEYHLECHRVQQLDADAVLTVLEKIDPWRRHARFCQFLLACEADARGCQGSESRDYPQTAFLQQAYAVTQQVEVEPLLAQGLQGQALTQAIHEQRLIQIRAVMAD